MWLIYTLIAGILFTFQGLLSRHVLKGEKDAWAYSFYFSAVGALISFPFMLFSPQIPLTFSAWGLALVIGILIVVNNWLVFKSTNTLEASLGGALNKFRLIWIFLFGIFLLNEPFSWLKIVGIGLTIVSGLVVVKKFKHPEKMVGITYVLLSTITNAIIIFCYKQIFLSFNVASATFFAVFLIPAILNFLLMPKAISRITQMAKTDGKLIFFSTALAGLGNIAINQSFAIGEVSRIAVISEAFLIVTLILEHLYFKERAHLQAKLLAVALAIGGALFIVWK